MAGDHGQLTAVESGGGSELIDRNLEYAQLVEAIRFTAEWEREASLRLRTGTPPCSPNTTSTAVSGAGTLTT